MNRYQELITQPLYSYKVQEQLNTLPSFAKARTDKNSNYQSILNDLAVPILQFGQNAFIEVTSMRLDQAETNDSTEFFLYASPDPEKIISDTTFIYKVPKNVSAYQFDGESDCNLITIPNMEKTDLTYRLPLLFKEKKEVSTSIEVLSAIERKEYLLRVKNPCFIGFQLTPKSGTTYKNSDFYYKFVRNNESFYSFSFAQILGQNGIPMSDVLLMANEAFSFNKEFLPGIYTLKFSLLEDSQLDNFDIEIIENSFFDKSKKKKIFGAIQNFDSLRSDFENTMWVIEKTDNGSDNEYLLLKAINALSDYEQVVHDAYTLLNEEDAIQVVDDWASVGKLLYTVKHPDSAESLDTTKLYLYDLYLTGNKFIYENNNNHFLDLVCEDIPFVAKDEEHVEKVTIETRVTSLPSDIHTTRLRLKIKNSENSDEITGEPIEYYINAEGEVVNEDEAWIGLGDQQLRWDLYLDNIGSYKVICEALMHTNERGGSTVVEAGAKILTVKYKVPWKVFDLKTNYYGWKFGSDSNANLEFSNGVVKNVLSFYKDGYYFDENSGQIWTNIECSKLLVEY